MIYVFKTFVKTKKQVKKLKPHINKIVPSEKWNFDLEDCDKILRIDCEENIVLEKPVGSKKDPTGFSKSGQVIEFPRIITV